MRVKAFKIFALILETQKVVRLGFLEILMNFIL